jgi:tripartite ATP-independent transporter DctM subunit
LWITLFGSLFSLLLSGIWIGAALGITGLLIMQFWGAGIPLLGGAAFESINVYGLIALPGFIFMGQIVLNSGLGQRIYNSVSPLMARFPGKLLLSNVLICAMFAAVLGVSTANAAVVGSVAIPELRKRKYNERLLLGTICGSGTLGLMIPPSGALVVYGVMANTSIAALFAAATIPGILMALGFMAFILIAGIIRPTIAPIDEKGLSAKDTARTLLGIWPLLLLMFVTVGPIYFGWATPAEGSGIGAISALVFGRLFGKLNWEDVKTSVINATETSSMLFFLVIGAMILSTAVSTLGAPRTVVNMVGQLPLEPIAILMLLYLMYIIMGFFMDGISMMLVTIPFICPIIESLGYSLLWFGIPLVMVQEIGLMTPPVGLNLFVVQGIAGHNTPISDVALGVLPLAIITTGILILVTIFPEIIFFLPRLLGLF